MLAAFFEKKEQDDPLKSVLSEIRGRGEFTAALQCLEKKERHASFRLRMT